MIALALAFAGSFLGALPPEKVDRPGMDATRSEPSDWKSAGLRGLVYDQGQWVPAEEIIRRNRDVSLSSSLRAEYAVRRAKAPGTARGQRSLAVWCESVGLKAESLAHFMAVARLDPDDADARLRLGLRLQGGQLRSEIEIAAEAIEAEAQARADRTWRKQIATWRRWLSQPEHRDEAIQALTEVRDPRAVPSVIRSFGDESEWEQRWAVKLLGRIDAPQSSQELARLSVYGLDDRIRLAAIDKLMPRDPRPFVGLLINWLREPIRYEIETGVLRVEGRSSIVERFYAGSSTVGRPSGAINEGMRRAVRDRQFQDTRTIDRANATIELTNARVERTLQKVTGVDLGPNAEPWTSWWTSELGYSYESPKPVPKPVVSEDVRVVYTPPPAVLSVPVHHSCFAAGTPVLTRTGPTPIEVLRVGDQVLTQDQESGELYFRPILMVFHNKPTPTVRVNLEGESIVATGIHRFWKARQGWTMARDLRPGDRVRTLGREVAVVSVRRDEVRPVFNLEVAEGHSFFVGDRRALVHDNSLVAPTPVPFDAVKAPGR